MSRQAFLRCIREHPGDDTPRLVYADWLDENGDAGDRDRAEFIRLQCRLHRHQREWEWLEQMPVEQWAGPEAEGDLLRELDPLVRRHTELCKLHVRDCATWSRDFVQAILGKAWWLQRCAAWNWGWSRGFVSHVQLPLPDYTRYAKAIFDLQPVEHIALPGVVRDGIVFRTSNGHHNDIDRDLWENLRMPKCEAGGECRMRGTHAHMNVEELSRLLVAYGRSLAQLPELSAAEAR